MHIVILPFPLLGHLNPCLLLARLLSLQGFTSTVALTEEAAAKAAESGWVGSQTIRYVTIPSSSSSSSSSEAESHSHASFHFLKAVAVMEGLRPGFETLLGRLAATASGVSCIIYNLFVVWAGQVASGFNIPAFCFHAANAHFFAMLLHAPALISGGLNDMDKMIYDIPGLLPLQVRDLPKSLMLYPSFILSLTKNIDGAAGIILNTVLELEKEPLEVIRKKAACYTIGPITLICGMEKLTEPIVGFWAEQRECLDWLNIRPNASVLFVAFGSLTDISCDQMKELAEGLEASGQAFVWVIRSNSTSTDRLLEGFHERTKERGLTISWAPQLEVLSHPAVGGFITHCGWNSVIENLALKAVPMICWPQIAEQRANQRLLVDKWKVGLELQEEDGVVKRTELEKIVRKVMQSDLGQELGKRSLQLKETIMSAVQEQGSSKCFLKALGEDIRQGFSSNQKSA